MTHQPLTFLFTDLENSTPLWEQYPNEMGQAAAQHDALIHKVIEKYRGKIVKSTGDGFHAVFEVPADGAAAALAGQQALSTQPWPDGTGPLKVRMGLHTGESQARGGDFYGIDVNLAARIMSLGYGGQVLLSEITAGLIKKSLPQDTTLSDLGEHRLKGIATPERIFQLCHPDLIPEFPPLKSLAAFKHNLHRQLSTFIGREQELADVKRLLSETQLLTLLGPGGTGKTRLMLQVAEEVIEDYVDGVWLVELAPLTDPDRIPERVISALKVQEQPNRQTIDTLTNYLRRKELLLLLDNVEHLVQESASLAEHLLEECPKLKILVTGREALFISGETTLQIPSLTLPNEKLTLEEIAASEGVQLFIERARAVRPDYALTEQNASTISEIIRRLDGIPLAIELAAARLRMLTVEQIAKRLDDRFRLLTGGRRTALPRQQTLQALIDWSWNLLDQNERVLLRRLSVFSGGWSIDAAQTVTGFSPLDEYEVFDALQGLINKSLVIVRHPPEGEARYNMLESIRQYAQNRLFEAGEGEIMRDRHMDHFVTLVDAYHEDGMGSEYFTWMKKFSLEQDNLRAVVGWIIEDRPQLALHFTGILLQYDPMWLPYGEARSWLEPIIEQTRKLKESGTEIVMKDFVRALQALGWLLVTHGNMIRGHLILDESINLARQHGELQLLAHTMGMKAQAMGTNVTQEVIEQLEELILLCRQNNQIFELFMVLFSTGQAYILQGCLDKGSAYLSEVIQLMDKIDVPIINAWIYYVQALLEQATHNPHEAEKYYLLAIEANEKWGHQRMVATARSELAHLYRQENQLKEALGLYRQTILSWQEQGHLSATAHQLECFAYIAIRRGQHERAALLLGAAQEARKQLNALSTEQQELDDLEAALAQLADVMGKMERDAVIAEGGKMNLDAAVLFALGEPD